MPGSGPRGAPAPALLLPLLLTAVACTTLPTTERPTPGPTQTIPTSLRIGVTGTGSLDPRKLDTPESILIASQVFDGLVAYDPSTSAVLPAVAERWDVLDGASRFEFHLRADATFHDGTPVRAEDFVFAWTRLADPATPAPFAFLLEPVAGFRAYHETLKARKLRGVVALDERRLEVRLTEPWPDFVALLGHPALSPVPPGAEEAGFESLPVGNGPFRVASEVLPGAPVVLSRYDAYTGAIARTPQVEFRLHATPEEAWPDFLASELDVAPIPAAVLPNARAEFGSGGIVELGRVLYCGVNTTIERLRHPELRRAISLALDRDAIASEVYGELARPATGLVPPSLPGFAPDACGDRCARDVPRAAALAAKLPKRARSLALDYADSPVGAALAQRVAAQLAEAGLVVTPRPHDEASFAELFRTGGHELFCLVWVADYPRQQALLEPLLRSGSPDNRTGLESEELDGLLARARAEGDPAARERLYQDAERRGLQVAPVVPLVWFRSRLAARPYVHGLQVDPLGGFDASALAIAG